MKKWSLFLIFIHLNLNISIASLSENLTAKESNISTLPNEILYIVFSDIFSENTDQGNIIDFFIDDIDKLKNYLNLRLVDKKFNNILKCVLKQVEILKPGPRLNNNLQKYLNKNNCKDIIDSFIENAYKIKNKNLIKILIEELKKFNFNIAIASTNKLIDAIKNNNLELTSNLIHAGANVNFKYHEKNKDIMLLLYSSHECIISSLINTYITFRQNIDANISDSDKWTPLMWAIKNNNIDLVNILLSSGADPNLRNSAEETALLHAIYWGYKDIAMILIQAGADINIKAQDNLTMLMLAANKNHIEILKLLLSLNLNPDEKNNRGFSALDFAKNTESQEILKKYMKNKNDYSNIFYKIIDLFKLIIA